MKTKDKIIVGFLSFFCVIAWTIEAYWFFHHNTIHNSTGFISSAFAFYGQADSTWFNIQAAPPFATAFMLFLEAIHIFGTQFLDLFLIYAIIKNRHYRYTLQLLISSYVSYSLLAYFIVHQIAGFPCMTDKNWASYTIFYAFNMPYAIYFWFTYDAVKQLNKRTLYY